MSEDRRYDDREVGLILKRVAELHERGGDTADGRSMTKDEIEQVVAELGISKALVSRAASEIALQDVRNRPVWWLGGKTELMFEEVVEGSIDESTLTQMLEILRRYLGDPGEIRREGGAQIWSTTSRTTRRVHFAVVEHAGSTTLRLEETMPMDARMTVGSSTFALGFAGFMAIVPLKALLIKSVLLLAMGPLTAVGATLGWLGGRTLWKHRSAGREDQLRRAFAEIVGQARQGNVVAVAPGTR